MASYNSTSSSRLHNVPAGAYRLVGGGSSSSSSSHAPASSSMGITQGLVSPRSNSGSLPNPASIASGLSSFATSSLYQPLSLADAIARSQGDVTRALDDVLAERNKFCLEAGKLSGENVRVWNLMGRIRKENESLKTRLLNAGPVAFSLIPSTDHSSHDSLNLSDATAVASPLAAVTDSANAMVAGNKKPLVEENSTLAIPSARSPPASGSVDSTKGGSPVALTGVSRSVLTSSQSFAPHTALPLVESAQLLTISTSESLSLPAGEGSSITTKAQTTRHEVPLSPGAVSIIQQREVAKTLQKRPSHCAAPASDRPHQSRDQEQGSGMNSCVSEGEDDYSAIDANSIGQDSTDVVYSGIPAPSKAAITSITDAQTPTKPVSADCPRGSVGSVTTASHGEGTLSQHGGFDNGESFLGGCQPAALRMRRKDLGGMGTTGDVWPGSTSSAMLHSTSSVSLRSSRSRLEPREATIAPNNSQSSEGGLSLAQALAEMANLEPPGGFPAMQPRLDDHILKYATVRVNGTNVRSGERAKEVVSFFLVVELSDAAPSTSLSKWRIEKSYADVLALDAKVKHKHGKAAVKKMNISGAQLPDKNLFKDHAPSKVDLRKSMLERYLRNLLEIPLTDKEEVCTFLCTDVVPLAPSLNPKSLFKEGFLTKKGQNLGRWVTRFYSLDGSRLDYFDGRGGALLGSINVRGAQIGRQQKGSQSDTDENSYRHAFLVLEKRTRGPELTSSLTAAGSKDSTNVASPAGAATSQLVRHVLCAESDEERDEWVDVLVRAIAEVARLESGGPLASRGTESSQTQQQQSRQTVAQAASLDTVLVAPAAGSQIASSPTSPLASQGPSRTKRSGSLSRRYNKSRDGFSNGNLENESASIATSNALNPVSSLSGLAGENRQSLPTSSSTSSSDHHGGSNTRMYRPSISGPMNGAPIPTGYKFGAKEEDSRNQAVAVPDRRRFWHRFAGGISSSDKARESRGAVFGVSLADSIAVSSVNEGLALPSVVYRCIEFLEKKNAIMEEGIYRLSGSTADVKALRDQFNAEGDVDLLADEMDGCVRHDPHAIAGLLKTFLRELPTGVLTHELHMSFMRVSDIADWKERVRELGQLVSALPLPNFSLLRTLCRHLIKVISYQDINKMTMRNVGIVFSPTLAIPAGIFALFLTSFDYCFCTDAKGEPAPREIESAVEAAVDVEGSLEQQQQAGKEIDGDSKPNTPTNLDSVPPHRSSSLLQSASISSGSGRQRPNQNSMNSFEEEAQKLIGNLSLEQHRLLDTHPEDPNNYDGSRVNYMSGSRPSSRTGTQQSQPRSQDTTLEPPVAAFGAEMSRQSPIFVTTSTA